MRKIALTLTLSGVVLCGAGMSVSNDFTDLLGDLSYSDEALQIPEPLHVAKLAPAPVARQSEEEFAFPFDHRTQATAASNPMVAMSDPFALPVDQAEPNQEPDFSESPFNTPAENVPVIVGNAPLASGSEATIEPPLIGGEGLAEIPEPIVAPAEPFTKLESAPAQQETAQQQLVQQSAEPAQPEPVVDPEPQPVADPQPLAIMDSQMAAPCNSCNSGWNQSGCDDGAICQPHVTPQLPSSTLRQYFRTDPCNAHVWDGYRRNCSTGLDHVHGKCDCFDPNRKGWFGVKKRSSQSNCDVCDR